MGVTALVQLEDEFHLAGSVHTEAYQAVLKAIVTARRGAGLSQAQLADAIGKPPSFVGKYELGERRLDIVELLVILTSLNLDFQTFWQSVDVDLPDKL